MDYEKAYKDALERARKFYNDCVKGDNPIQAQRYVDIFPELKESEDEKIGNLIYCLIRDRSDNQKLLEHNGVSVDKALAYLGKQKELPFVKDVMLGYPGHYFYDGERMHFCGNPAMEEKQKEQQPKEVNVKALLTADRLASAEMTGRLKERSEIIDNPEKYGLQKPADWSKENGNALKYLHELISFGFSEKFMDAQTAHDMREWLNTRLKSIRPQQKQEWSEEDKKILENIILDLIGFRIYETDEELISAYKDEIAWLKSLPERFNPQPKQEWSEEDEEMIARICANLEYLVKEAGCDSKLKEKLEERIKWMKRLKFLKNRGNFPKNNTNSPSWKPSEEQVSILGKVFAGCELNTSERDSMVDLFYHLKDMI